MNGFSEQVQTDGTNWTSVSYSYSGNGCLTNNSETGQSLSYDYDNRLIAVSSQQSAVSYIYDAAGARVGRIDGTTTNYFVVDYVDGLKRPLAETDSSGAITRYYVWSGSMLLCHIEANGNAYYYHSDELGSTLALSDETGAVTDQFAYMPYGYAMHSGTNSTPFQWLGGYGVYYDEATDLHLTLHRAYSSSLKCFIQPDPLGIDGGANVYAMANLNPLFFVDPYGLCADSFGSKALSFGQSALNGLGSVLSAPDRFLNWATGTDEYDRFNVAVNTPIPYDDMIVGGLGMLTKSGAFLSALKFANKVEDAIPDGPVIIGETMRRVSTAAKQYPGATILDDMPNFKAMGMSADEVTSSMMQYNRQWILEQMRSGKEIIDIGSDANRATPSIFYQMEQNMLKNYQQLHPEFSGAVSP